MKDTTAWLALAVILMVLIFFNGWSRMESYRQDYEIAEMQAEIKQIHKNVEAMQDKFNDFMGMEVVR